MDSVPMVAFTGNVTTDGIGRDSFQEAYIEGITMPITKHNFTVRRVEELADTMRSAFRIAQSGRKGPVLVDIPKDVTAAVCEFTPKAGAHPHRYHLQRRAGQVGSGSYQCGPAPAGLLWRRRAQRSLLPAAA